VGFREPHQLFIAGVMVGMSVGRVTMFLEFPFTAALGLDCRVFPSDTR